MVTVTVIVCAVLTIRFYKNRNNKLTNELLEFKTFRTHLNTREVTDIKEITDSSNTNSIKREDTNPKSDTTANEKNFLNIPVPIFPNKN